MDFGSFCVLITVFFNNIVVIANEVDAVEVGLDKNDDAVLEEIQSK